MEQTHDRVLVLAAHPDDAELCVGGMIARFRERGADVGVATFTTPERSPEAVDRRRRAAAEAAAILDHRLIWIADGDYEQVEDIPEYQLVALVDEVIKAENPNIVIAPWAGDSHVDHMRLARATIASSRRWRADLYAYPPADYRTVCFHRFQPNVFVDITPFLDQKRAAIRVFSRIGVSGSLLDETTLVRLWSYYGALSGCEYAEGLLLQRARWLASMTRDVAAIQSV